MAEKIKTVILGIGNTLLGDEGVGVHAVKKLDSIQIPGSVLLVDGSTAGFKLLALFEKHKDALFIIIDAVRAGDHKKSGDVYLVPLDDFYDIDHLEQELISFHQTALIDVLDMFYLTHGTRIKGYFIGINISVPDKQILDFSMGLSKKVQASLDKVTEIVKTLI